MGWDRVELCKEVAGHWSWSKLSVKQSLLVELNSVLCYIEQNSQKTFGTNLGLAWVSERAC